MLVAINTITGKPGSGKTYLAICLLIEQYYKKNGNGAYDYRSPNVEVVTNIDGFQLPHINISDYCREHNITFNDFYTADFQENFTKETGKKIVHVIDECQRQIGPRFKDENVIYYFDYHRHFDHEIWLISQDRTKICKQISVLSEFEFRAIPRSLSFAGELKYNVLQSGEHVEKKFLKPSKEIYGLYKSAISHNQKTKKSKLFLYVIIALVLGIFFFFLSVKRLIPDDSEPLQTYPVENQSRTLPQVDDIQPVSNLDPDRYAWVEVAYIATERSKRLFLYDHLTRQFMISSDYPFPYKLRGARIYAYIPARIIQARQAQSDARATPRAGELASIGGADSPVVTPTARAFQHSFRN